MGAHYLNPYKENGRDSELCLSADNRPICKWAAKLHDFWGRTKQNPLERSNGPPSWIHGLPKPSKSLNLINEISTFNFFKIKSFKLNLEV